MLARAAQPAGSSAPATAMAKLQLRDRVQAVVLAYETGLVTPAGQPASQGNLIR